MTRNNNVLDPETTTLAPQSQVGFVDEAEYAQIELESFGVSQDLAQFILFTIGINVTDPMFAVDETVEFPENILGLNITELTRVGFSEDDFQELGTVIYEAFAKADKNTGEIRWDDMSQLRQRVSKLAAKYEAISRLKRVQAGEKLPQNIEPKITEKRGGMGETQESVLAWMHSERYEHIMNNPDRRRYEREVHKQLGRVSDSLEESNYKARKLFDNMKTKQQNRQNLMAGTLDFKKEFSIYTATGGVMDGTAAAQMAEAGHEALYLSGWQASHHWAEPDLAKYPWDTVPKVIESINRYLKNKDRDQQRRYTQMKNALSTDILNAMMRVQRTPENQLENLRAELVKSLVNIVEQDKLIFYHYFRDSSTTYLNSLFNEVVNQIFAAKKEANKAAKLTNKLTQLNNSIDQVLKSYLVDYLIPIYADGDTGHDSVKHLTRRMAEVGAGAIHLEDQAHGQKKCGHMSGKVLTSTAEHYKRLIEARQEADRIGSEIMIVARTDAEAAEVIDSNSDPTDHYFIKGTTKKDIPSLSYIIRLSRREVAEYDHLGDSEEIIATMKKTMPGASEDEIRNILGNKTPEQLVNDLEAKFPDIAKAIRKIWALRGEVGNRLEHNAQLKFPSTGQIIGDVSEIWNNRAAIELGEYALAKDTVLEDEKGNKFTVAEILKKEPSNLEDELKAMADLTSLWGSAADLKTYTQAVSEAIMNNQEGDYAGLSKDEREKRKALWEAATDPLKFTLSIDQQRQLAKKMLNIEINWDWEPARTYEGYYQLDNKLGSINAAVRMRKYLTIADVGWMEQGNPDVAQAREFVKNVTADPRVANAFFAINLSPSFNWSNPDNWKASLTPEQIANIKKAMAFADFDWQKPESWHEYKEDVQAMVDVIMTFSYQIGLAGYNFQFVTIFQDHVSTRAIYEVGKALREFGAGGFVTKGQQMEQKINAPFEKHQDYAGVHRVSSDEEMTARGSSSTGAAKRKKGKTGGDTMSQFGSSGPKITRGALKIDPAIASKHPSLFGKKTVNGKELIVEDVIATMHIQLDPERKILRGKRKERDDKIATGALHNWNEDGTVFADVDGDGALTRTQIRKGLVDNALGRDSTERWRLNDTVAINPEVMRPGLQGTGPADDLGMVMGSINAAEYGAASWMDDWEDAAPGKKFEGACKAYENYRDVIDGKYPKGFKWVHPTKKYTKKDAADGNIPSGSKVGDNKIYTIKIDREKWPILFSRVPGLHLNNEEITYDGEPVSATMVAFVMNILTNYDSQARNNTGLYHYMPKVETPQEAMLVAKILKTLEATINVPRGTLKIEMLNERGTYAKDQEVIMWILRKNLIGANVGRWDYINSLIHMHKDNPNAVFADPHTISMVAPPLHAYTRRDAIMCLLASLNDQGEMTNGMPLGGMAAGMKSGDAVADQKALKQVKFDKLRERLTGLLVLNGRLYDTYRQSWVATTDPDYVASGAAPLLAKDIPALQIMVDELDSDQKALLKQLGLINDANQITPYEITEDVLQNLWSDDAWKELFTPITGQITEEGIRRAIHWASEYMYQQQNGNNAAAIFNNLDNKPTEGRLMNDFATYEIFWHWLWTVAKHGAKLTADGETTKAGQVVDAALIERLINEKFQKGQKFIDAQGDRHPFDKTKLPYVMDMLKRQVLNPNYIPYGSKLLYGVIDKTPKEREQILEAMTLTREQVVEKVISGQYLLNTLKTYDELYNIMNKDYKLIANMARNRIRFEILSTIAPTIRANAHIVAAAFKAIHYMLEPNIAEKADRTFSLAA